MKDLSESLSRTERMRAAGFTRRPTLREFPSDAMDTVPGQPEPETDDARAREMQVEAALLLCPPCNGNCTQSRTCPARTSINDEPLFHAADLYIAAIAVAVIGGVVMGVL